MPTRRKVPAVVRASVEPRKVLLVCEQKGWVFERISQRIAGELKHAGFEPEVCDAGSLPRKITHEFVLLVWWGSWAQVKPKIIPKKTKVILFLYDHFTWLDYSPALFKEAMAASMAVFVSNKILQVQLKQHHGVDATNQPDGVDASRFVWNQRREIDNIVLGWAGNSTVSRKVKRLDLLKEAVSTFPDITLEVADASNPSTAVQYSQMPAWYSNIDVICSMSTTEGTPNPVLEGASCGKAIFSTPIGVVPELLAISKGGILVKDDSVEGIRQHLEILRAHKGHIYKWGRQNRAEIERAWTWKGRFNQLIETMRLSSGLPAQVIERKIQPNDFPESFGSRPDMKVLEVKTPGYSSQVARHISRILSSDKSVKFCASDSSSIMLEFEEGVLAEDGTIASDLPNLAVVYDSPNWAFHRIALQIQKHLQNSFNICLFEYLDLSRGRLQGYDYVINLALCGVPQVLSAMGEEQRGLVTCVYDHYTWRQAAMIPAFEEALQRSDIVLCANEGLLREIGEVYPHASLGLCVDGVDSNLFSPAMSVRVPEANVRVGWAGNSKHRYGVKRLSLIQAAAEKVVGIDLVLADGNNIPHSEMPQWYRDLDVLTCASVYEGTPNPILEAAACGVSFISTSVGVVPQLGLLTDGDPGAIIQGESSAELIDGFVSQFEFIVKNRQVLVERGKVARKTIVEERWDWVRKVKQFSTAIEMIAKRV